MSGKPICTIGSMSLGACGESPIPAITPSAPTVLIGGRPAITVGSFWNHHDDHSEYTVVGNPTVLVQGRPIVTIGCVMSHGDITGTGNPTVLA